MNKYLILEFSCAKLFNSAGKDIVVHSPDFRESRIGTPHFVEPITFFQITNMLHVLFGERPVPSLRKSPYKRQEHYDEMAKNSLIRISDMKINNKFQTESILTKKAVWNSWKANGVVITWNILEKYCDDNFSWFVKKLEEALQIKPMKLSAELSIEKYRKFRKSNQKNKSFDEKFSNELKEKSLTGLYRFIEDKKFAYQVTSNERSPLLNINGFTTVSKLNGELIVPVSSKDIETLRLSAGFANILDGGFVKIKSISNGSEISDDGFIKVSTISTKKEIYAY